LLGAFWSDRPVDHPCDEHNGSHNDRYPQKVEQREDQTKNQANKLDRNDEYHGAYDEPEKSHNQRSFQSNTSSIHILSFAAQLTVALACV
jgi:hypothetical protein